MKTKTNDGKPVKLWMASRLPNVQDCYTTQKEAAFASRSEPGFKPVQCLVIPLTAESVAELRETIALAVPELGKGVAWDLPAADRILTALGITPRKRVLRPSANKGGKAK